MPLYLGRQMIDALGGFLPLAFKLQRKTVTPSENSQTIIFDEGFDGLEEVSVEAIQTENIDISSNGTYTPSVGKYFKSVVVSIAERVFQTQTKTVSPTESSQDISPDAGYDGLSKVTVAAISTMYVGSGITKRSGTDLTVNGKTVTVPSGYYSAQQSKSVSDGSVTLAQPTVSSTGLVTASATVTAGYISGNPTNKTLQLTTQAAKSITPTKSSQTAVPKGVYTTGDVTVAAIPSEYIVPSGSQTLTENKQYDVTSLSSVTVSVPTSGDGGMNVQAYLGVNSVSATAYTATNTKLTVAKTGTYKVSWMGWRNTNGGTNGSQLYINGSAYGSANTTFTNTYGQRVELSNVSLTAGQEIVVRARSRSTSYVMAVGNLIIQQTA